MKVKFIFASIILVLVINGYANNFYLQKNQDAEKGIEGIWQGTLKISGIELRILFKIKVEQDGSFSATMDSPDQGAFGIACTTTEYKDKTLTITVTDLTIEYVATLTEDNVFDGKFTQMGQVFDMDLKKKE